MNTVCMCVCLRKRVNEKERDIMKVPTAAINALQPSLLTTSTAAPAASRRLTTSVAPALAAAINAVPAL